MRWLWLVVLAMTLGACGRGGDARAPQDDAASPHRTLRQGEQGFALLRNGDTIAVERYTRTGDVLQGEVFDIQDNARLEYNARVGADERITRIELSFYSNGETAPRQQAVAEFRGDTVTARSRDAGEDQETERLVTPEGTTVHVGVSVAMLEQLLRRARAVGGDTTSLPVLLVSSDEDRSEPIQRVTVRRLGQDSVHVFLDGQNQVRVAVDAQGRIQGGANPAAEIRMVRLR
jgi:hypothetical protein